MSVNEQTMYSDNDDRTWSSYPVGNGWICNPFSLLDKGSEESMRLTRLAYNHKLQEKK